MRASIAALLATSVFGGAAPPEPPQGTAPDRTKVDPSPCLPPFRKAFRCPDLVIRRPHGMYAEYRGGHTLLRAGNSLDNIGKGPAELHGRRIGPRFMRARQRIVTRNGRRRIAVKNTGRLQYKLAHLGLHWWKWYNAARFELWRVDGRGRRTRLVRVGRKVAYCLRDLRRTRPNVPRSPANPVYPACDTYAGRSQVTLGTSPGW